jgi:hypothetical protein
MVSTHAVESVLIDIYCTWIDDSPERNHVDYELSSHPETLTTESTTLGPVETSARPNKTRRELWWIDPEHTSLSLASIARRFDNLIVSIPSSSFSPLRRLHNLEERRSLHRCPGYLREEILLGSDLAKSAIISHSTPNVMERCSGCGKLVSSGAGNKHGCWTCRIRRKVCTLLIVVLH